MNFRLILVAGAILYAGTSFAQECFPVPDGLVAWWPGDGNTVDVQGGNDGILVNGATFDIGMVGDAFSVDGIDDYIEVAHSADFNIQNALSLAAWIKKQGPCNNNCPIVAKQNGVSPCCGDLRYATLVYGWGDQPATFSFNTTYWKDVVVSNTSIIDGEWYFIVGAWDGNIAKIYINGQFDNDKVWGAPIKPTTEGLLYIGAGRHGYDEHFNGLIDEVQIYDRELTAAEIQEMYLAGSAGICNDEDGDGFRPPLDCDDTNPSINPDALELPGNFTDENCDGNLGNCHPCIDWRNHGDYVRCVAHAVNDLDGLLSDEEGDNLVSSAAQSDIGKRGFFPAECN